MPHDVPPLRCPVNVLLARRSAEEASLAAELLRRDGYVVEATTEASELVRLCSASPFDAVVVDTHLSDASGLEALRLVRGRRTLRGAAVYLTTDPPDGEVRAQASELGVRGVLLNPISLLELAELLRALPAEAEGAGRPPPRLGPLGDLAACWRDRRTGVVHVTRPSGIAWVLLSEGSPLDEEGLRALVDGLGDAELVFEPCEVDNHADAPDLGAALWELARATAAAEPPPPRARTLLPSAATQELCRLPLDPHTVAVLRVLDGPTSVRKVAERLGWPWEEMERTASALAVLGLVDLAEGVSPAPRRSPDTARPGVVEVTQFGASSEPPEDARTAPRPAPRRPPAEPVLSPPPAPAEPRPAGALDADTDPLVRPAADTRSPATLVRSLTRELRVLEANDDWTALAAPAGSGPELIAAAHARMAARYAPLRQHAHPEVAELAGRVAARIDEAAARLRGNGGSTAPTLDAQLRVGRALVDRADWARAERHFERLREANPDSPDPLAWLGWTRFHDPARSEQARLDDGRGSIELALLFAPAHRDGNLFLAEIALAEGDHEQAGRHLDRVLQVEPGNPQAIKLVRRVDEARRAATRAQAR